MHGNSISPWPVMRRSKRRTRACFKTATFVSRWCFGLNEAFLLISKNAARAGVGRADVGSTVAYSGRRVTDSPSTPANAALRDIRTVRHVLVLVHVLVNGK